MAQSFVSIQMFLPLIVAYSILELNGRGLGGNLLYWLRSLAITARVYDFVRVAMQKILRIFKALSCLLPMLL